MKRLTHGDEMKQRIGGYISVHQKFKITIWKHPMGKDFDMVSVCVYVCVCVSDGVWAEKKQLPTSSCLHQTGTRQGNPCQVRECVGVVGGCGGPSGELAPGPKGRVGSLVSKCIQNRLSCISKSGKSSRCWLRLSLLGCRTKIHHKVTIFWILNTIWFDSVMIINASCFILTLRVCWHRRTCHSFISWISDVNKLDYLLTSLKIT